MKKFYFRSEYGNFYEVSIKELKTSSDFLQAAIEEFSVTDDDDGAERKLIFRIVKVKKDTFKSMEQVIKDTKKVMEMQPKLQTMFNVDSYANSYKSLEKENQKYKKEISSLESKNRNLERKNKSLLLWKD